MTSSLVGSEMCIRDRIFSWAILIFSWAILLEGKIEAMDLARLGSMTETVSYTHLTLPTICSV
eukprot:7246182-Prorocentrum_lima.AAC.1